MCTHSEFIKIAGLDERKRCSARDQVFGGRCMNCGYNPELFAAMSVANAEKYYYENVEHLNRHLTF